MTHQICKIVTLFVLFLQLTLPIQARLEPALAAVEGTAQNDDILYYAPSLYGDDMFPESTYSLDYVASELEGRDEQYPPSPSPSPSPSTSAYSPGIEQDHPYSGEYVSPSPAPYIDVMAPEVDDFYGDDYDSPSEAPSPTNYIGLQSGASVAIPPPAEWEYRAEDDAVYLSGEDDGDEEGYGGENKRGAIGFVMGAVCLVGLGGLVYRRRKANQNKRRNLVYSELTTRTGDV